MHFLNLAVQLETFLKRRLNLAVHVINLAVHVINLAVQFNILLSAV